MSKDPGRPRTSRKHAAYWNPLGLPQYAGGPSATVPGSFEATSEDHAAELVSNDHFQREHLVNQSWLKVWCRQ
jgi:hypothetical protein